MKTLLVSALALGALSSAALAEPVELTDAAMDGVTAAGFVGFGAFGTAGPTAFRSTPVPPLTGSFDPFLSRNRALIVVGDDDLAKLRRRRDIRFAAPARRGFFFRESPVTVIIVNKNIIALDGDLDD